MTIRRGPRPVTGMVRCCALAAILAGPACAQEIGNTGSDRGAAADPPSTPPTRIAKAEPVALERVELSGRHYDNGIGTSDAASQGAVRAELLKSRPALRPGEVLEFVPGLIVTQHSGDGKANQYFLRGFNLDHGTDFATTVMGLPVNMPSHAHGQGYSDLNFLMPELVERIDYRKGPYFARNGDFAAAGSADIGYVRRLDEPFVALTLGEGRYRRALAAGSAEVGDGMSLLAAVEGMRNDGPWTTPEDLDRRNLVLGLSGGRGGDKWRVALMDYRADWTSTDQVPQRLIDAGTHEGRPFGRFDAIDPTDGGRTRRGSLSGEWQRDTEGSSTRIAAYAMAYKLSLYSNFTYAMERPEAGDQFSQQDDRKVYGLSGSHAVDHALGGLPARSEFGFQVRQDRARVGLFKTVGRVVVDPANDTTRDDDVRETLSGVYGQTSVELAPWARTVLGVRADQGRFRVDHRAGEGESGRVRDSLVSPKFSLVLGPWARTEFFVNAGRGFHSNDARGVTAAVDPAPGLVKAKGYELGLRGEWLPGLQTSLALWKLDFDSELVYVGDAGATEANRPSRRRGIEWNNRYVPLPWLLIDADFAWTHARFSDADPVGNRIPNAVDKVASMGVTVRELGPWSASLQWRYLGSGALVEDNSVRSHASLTTNLRVSRRFGAKTELTLDVFNLMDRKVNDIEYLYESQLRGEDAPVADRHVHPAEPRTVRVTLRRSF
ncbi:TonB-dependent receptor [Mitsuaria sp. GD03876]|uniref:TonB-dependent receptor n=1 Tax=Mitsuaria sp. GD03876 TaxID=2975399 RepID=UPI0024497EE0|nr:TonB-dependent receptor [Mitsuaria sp. GD03876]MDH0866789.1 TonB-dependent receptor [Mitsuaria sp. GD03876]